MLRPDTTKWNQTLDDLLHGSLYAAHARTRERYLALYMISSGETNATQWAQKTGRSDETIMQWVHNYDEFGPESLIYRRTGGSLPLFRLHIPLATNSSWVRPSITALQVMKTLIGCKPRKKS